MTLEVDAEIAAGADLDLVARHARVYRRAAETDDDLRARVRDGLARETERQIDTLRFCLRQPYGGKTAPSGYVCTGAFDPNHLRSGKSQFEPQIQAILAEDAKFGVRYD